MVRLEPGLLFLCEDSTSMSHKSLEGIRVLDLSRLLPGPFLTMVLADMGADVIKIEAPVIGDYLRQLPPTKGKMSGRFLSVNRDKRSLVLNLKDDKGRDAFMRLVETADVVVESFRPGVMRKLGIDFEALQARNKNVILCSISGYGQSGPYEKRAGHDLNYIALAGVLAMGGERNGKPMMPGTQIADLAGGGLWGATAILGALVGRERNGGQHLDISMTEGSLALLAAEIGNLDCVATPPTRGAETLNGALACYGVYETKDKKFIAVGALEPKFWMAFNNAIGRKGDMGEVIAPQEKQAAIREEIAGLLMEKNRDQWSEIFAAHDCCTEAVLEIDELQDHPLHKSRQVFFTIPSEDGEVLQVRTPVGQASAKRLAPTLGQHSEEVLREHGFSDEEIAGLVQ
jgi:crotonobetainyl-CoA:carnitine CoA-transferase CaiB-like acyl-CoA transferase